MFLIYCITGTLKFDTFLLKLDELLLPMNPVRTTLAGCLRGSDPRSFLQAVMGLVVKLSIRLLGNARVSQCCHY